MAVHVVGVAALDGEHHLADVAAVDDAAETGEVFPHPALLSALWNWDKNTFSCRYGYFFSKLSFWNSKYTWTMITDLERLVTMRFFYNVSIKNLYFSL